MYMYVICGPRVKVQVSSGKPKTGLIGHVLISCYVQIQNSPNWKSFQKQV